MEEVEIFDGDGAEEICLNNFPEKSTQRPPSTYSTPSVNEVDGDGEGAEGAEDAEGDSQQERVSLAPRTPIKDIFEEDDIGESLQNLFEPEETKEGEDRPLSPHVYNELLKEYKENREKLDSIEQRLDNLTEEEKEEYERLLDLDRYYLDQRVKNFEASNKEISKNMNLINSRLQELEELKENIEKSINSNKIREEELAKESDNLEEDFQFQDAEANPRVHRDDG